MAIAYRPRPAFIDMEYPAIPIGEAARARSLECVIERDGFRVRLADSPSQRSKASVLIKRMYSWRGYLTKTVTTHPSRNQLMFVVSSVVEQELFATLTLGLDSEEGLLADALYEEKIDVFRAAGRKVCELSKLAVDPRYGSKGVFASLFHLAYIYARFHQVTDAFIEETRVTPPFTNASWVSAGSETYASAHG